MKKEKFIKTYQSLVDMVVNPKIEKVKEEMKKTRKSNAEGSDPDGEKLRSLIEWRDTYLENLVKRLVDLNNTVVFGEVWESLNTNKHFIKDLIKVVNAECTDKEIDSLKVTDAMVEYPCTMCCKAKRVNKDAKIYILNPVFVKNYE